MGNIFLNSYQAGNNKNSIFSELGWGYQETPCIELDIDGLRITHRNSRWRHFVIRDEYIWKETIPWKIQERLLLKQHFSKARETNDYETERPNLMIGNFTTFTPLA
jgi:hypothetical protein